MADKIKKRKQDALNNMCKKCRISTMCGRKVCEDKKILQAMIDRDGVFKYKLHY